MYHSASIIRDSATAARYEQAAPQVRHAIKQASRRTGVDFSYLVHQAAAESNFNSKAQAKTSSASGLYQFIESTWLQMVKRHGADYGLGRYADQIGERGKVKDPALREEILALREDPEIASYLAAEFADENARYLSRHLNDDYGPVGGTELYFAHFLGAGGAAGFLNAYQDNPMATAADLFPKAAQANRNVFYDRATGEPRTLAGVYDFFSKKFDQVAPQTPEKQQARPALMAGARPTAPVPSASPASFQSPTALKGFTAYDIIGLLDAAVPFTRKNNAHTPLSSDRTSPNNEPSAFGRAYPASLFRSFSAQAAMIRQASQIMALAALDTAQGPQGQITTKEASQRYAHIYGRRGA